MSDSKTKKTSIFRLIAWIENILMIIAGASLIIMLGVMTFGILSRELFDSPVLWTNDLASYLMVYLAFLAAPWVLKEKGHVAVDILTSNFKGKMKKINIVFVSVVSIIACFLYFLFSFEIVTQYFVNGTVMLENLPWPKFALYLPITIGSFFLMIRFLLIMIEVFHKKQEDIDVFDEKGGI